MRKYIVATCLIVVIIALFNYCSDCSHKERSSLVHEYGDILDISYTPSDSTYCRGWFSDQGS